MITKLNNFFYFFIIRVNQEKAVENINFMLDSKR